MVYRSWPRLGSIRIPVNNGGVAIGAASTISPKTISTHHRGDLTHRRFLCTQAVRARDGAARQMGPHRQYSSCGRARRRRAPPPAVHLQPPPKCRHGGLDARPNAAASSSRTASPSMRWRRRAPETDMNARSDRSRPHNSLARNGQVPNEVAQAFAMGLGNSYMKPDRPSFSNGGKWRSYLTRKSVRYRSFCE